MPALPSHVASQACLNFHEPFVVVCVALQANGISSYRDASNIEQLMSQKSPLCTVHILTDNPQDVKVRHKNTRVHHVISASLFLQILTGIFNSIPNNSSILFTISSHGYTARTVQSKQQEVSGLSEYIMVGRDKVFDFDLSLTIVRSVHPSCRVFAIMDTCHSGTMIDLHYTSMDALVFQRTKYSYGLNTCRCFTVSACSDLETAGEDISEYGGWGGKLSCQFLDYAVTRTKINWLDWFVYTKNMFLRQQQQCSHPVLSIL